MTDAIVAARWQFAFTTARRTGCRGSESFTTTPAIVAAYALAWLRSERR